MLVSYGADYWLERAQYGGGASSARRPMDPEASASEILARGKAGPQPTTTRARRRRVEGGRAQKVAKAKKAASKKGGGGGFGR